MTGKELLSILTNMSKDDLKGTMTASTENGLMDIDKIELVQTTNVRKERIKLIVCLPEDDI